MSRPARVLAIGAGGGVDVIYALRGGAREITAVEINPIMIKSGLGSLSRFNGDLFRRPGVTPVVAEGRSFLTAARDRRWDLISRVWAA